VSLSPFFQQLRLAYEAELDDLTSDSEGRGVLRQRLATKRKELGFLVKMIEISPEMVAVVFHQAFRFVQPAVLNHLVSQDADDLPDWDAVSDAVELAPWAQDLVDTILAEPAGPWFMTLAVALEYLHSRPGPAARTTDEEDDSDREDGDERDDHDDDRYDDDGEADPHDREAAGADWLADQGFDRKD
jgi:hypothetical protein